MRVIIIIILVIVFLGYILVSAGKYEKLAPYDITNCKLKCQQQGQQMSWDGGPDGPWNDPATEQSSNFDVAGCMQECDNKAIFGQNYDSRYR